MQSYSDWLRVQNKLNENTFTLGLAHPHTVGGVIGSRFQETEDPDAEEDDLDDETEDEEDPDHEAEESDDEEAEERATGDEDEFGGDDEEIGPPKEFPPEDGLGNPSDDDALPGFDGGEEEGGIPNDLNAALGIGGDDELGGGMQDMMGDAGDEGDLGDLDIPDELMDDMPGAKAGMPAELPDELGAEGDEEGLPGFGGDSGDGRTVLPLDADDMDTLDAPVDDEEGVPEEDEEDIENPDFESEDDFAKTMRSYMGSDKKKCCSCKKHCSESCRNECQKCSPKKKGDFHKEGYETDNDFLASITDQAKGNARKKFSSGVTQGVKLEDQIHQLTDPNAQLVQPGEVGYAPQTRIGKMDASGNLQFEQYLHNALKKKR